MIISKNQFEDGIAKFADREIVAQLPLSSLERFAAKTVINLRHKILENKKIYDLLYIAGAMDCDGNIDIDIVRDTLSETMDNDGLTIDAPLLGKLAFSKTDIDTLYNDITRG
jgi:hypothetical protein